MLRGLNHTVLSTVQQCPSLHLFYYILQHHRIKIALWCLENKLYLIISGLSQKWREVFLLRMKGLDFSPWKPLSFKDLSLHVLSKVEITKVSTTGQCARTRCTYVVDLQSASAKIMLGLFPPSSRVTRFKLLLPAASWISFPTWKKGNGERFCTSCSWDHKVARGSCMQQWDRVVVDPAGQSTRWIHRISSCGHLVWTRYVIWDYFMSVLNGVGWQL